MSMTPVISLYPPWANWVAMGWKTIETRTHTRFKSLVGKRIGIHSSLKWDDGAIDAARPWLTEDQVRRTKNMLRLSGAIICTVKVDAFRILDKLDSNEALIDCENTLRYGLFLSDVKSVPVIPCKGKQGIWYAEIEELEVKL